MPYLSSTFGTIFLYVKCGTVPGGLNLDAAQIVKKLEL